MYYRVFHGLTRLVIQILEFPEQEILTGIGSKKELPNHIKKSKCSSVLIVTDRIRRGICDGLCKSYCRPGSESQPDSSENARSFSGKKAPGAHICHTDDGGNWI